MPWRRRRTQFCRPNAWNGSRSVEEEEDEEEDEVRRGLFKAKR
jgi:hypothetical protein